jgi:transcriptional regulator with XRE-family HTH domain
MNPAATLREHRLEAGLTQAELAERAGTSQATLSAYEAGRKQPTVDTYSRLLSAVGSRLTVVDGASPRRPSPAEQRRSAETLLRVLDLAEALPTRHEPELRFPRLRADSAPR